MERALNAAPWLAPVFAVILLMRKELAALFTASRSDSALEAMMGQMVGQFSENLRHFERLSGNSEKWLEEQKRTVAVIESLHETQRAIHTEMVRGTNQKGG